MESGLGSPREEYHTKYVVFLCTQGAKKVAWRCHIYFGPTQAVIGVVTQSWRVGK